MEIGVVHSVAFAALPAISDLEMSGDGCVHLKEYKSVKGYQAYRLIHAYFVSCTSAEARRRKASTRSPPSRALLPFFAPLFRTNGAVLFFRRTEMPFIEFYLTLRWLFRKLDAALVVSQFLGHENNYLAAYLLCCFFWFLYR